MDEHSKSVLKTLQEIQSRKNSDDMDIEKTFFDEINIYKGLFQRSKIFSHAKQLEPKTRDLQNVRSPRRDYEAAKNKFRISLASHYRSYLTKLQKICDNKKTRKRALGSRLIAELVYFTKSFDYNRKLLRIAIQNANSKHLIVSKPCLIALQKALATEKPGKINLIIMNRLLKLVRITKNETNPSLLYLPLYIQCRTIGSNNYDAEGPQKNDILDPPHKIYKKTRKRDSRNGQAREKTSFKKKKNDENLQTQLLRKIIVIYLRIMESSNYGSEAQQEGILIPVFEGLKNFSHFLSAKLCTLLIETIQNIVENQGQTSINVALHALVAVSFLMEQSHKDVQGNPKILLKLRRPHNASATLPITINQGQSLFSKLRCFHDTLYGLFEETFLTSPCHEKVNFLAVCSSSKRFDKLGKHEKITRGKIKGYESDLLCSRDRTRSHITCLEGGEPPLQLHSPSYEQTQHIKLFFSACETLLLKPKRLPLCRVAAFVRRASIYLTNSSSHVSMGLLQFVQILLHNYPSLRNMVRGEEGQWKSVASSGKGSNRGIEKSWIMNSSRPDSDLAACRKVLWEIHHLTRSYHPSLRQKAHNFLRTYHRNTKNLFHFSQSPTRTSTNPTSSVLRGKSQELDQTPSQLVIQYDTSKGDFRPSPQPPKCFHRG